VGAELRSVAAQINAAVIANGVSVDRALEDTAIEAPRDAALLRAISYGSLRWHYRLQWQCDQLLTRPLRKRDAILGALLRVGLFQLQWLRIPDHAAVSATVAAAEVVGAAGAKSLINAVLRRFLRERAALDERMQAAPEALTSHPAWLLGVIEHECPDAAAAIVAANNQPPPMWLRINALRTNRAAYLQLLASHGIAAQAAHEPATAVLLEQPRPTAELPGYADGLVSVQDAAAQFAAGYLQPQPGQRVLDACAAPGGKSAHILESCPQLDTLLAIDADAERLAVVEANFKRLGLVGRTRCGDAGQPADWWDGKPFDRILLDAPCSALGVIRRHPDIKVLRRPDDLAAVAAQQARLLAALWPMLVPGGRLVYATCTITRRENYEQIEKFLHATGDAVLSGPDSDSGRQICPGEANMDGFYYACLDKR